MKRVLDAWHELAPDQRLAGIASLGLFLTMFLPWYQQNAVVSVSKGEPLVSRDMNAFAVFSFVEAAVMLVAAAVLFLLFARAEHRSFHLPGSDGTVILIAGGWAALLLVWRLFDKPGITSHGVAANVGVQWGIFFALAAAGLLTYAGSRMRLGRRQEVPAMRRPRSRRAEGEAVHPPAPVGGSVQGSSEVPVEDPTVVSEQRPRPRYPPPPTTTPSTAGGRALREQRRPVRADSDQLSFEDTTHTPDEPPSKAA